MAWSKLVGIVKSATVRANKVTHCFKILIGLVIRFLAFFFLFSLVSGGGLLYSLTFPERKSTLPRALIQVVNHWNLSPLCRFFGINRDWPSIVTAA